MTEIETTTAETFIDPICGMRVKPLDAAGSLNKNGETYYFCSTGCLQKFIAPNNVTAASCCSGNEPNLKRYFPHRSSHGRN